MLVKWIVCKVTEEYRDAFSKAQEQWAALHGVDGFWGQFGGWNVNDASEACIVGLWRDMPAYRYFMEHVHDEIFEGNAQGKTYESISVLLADSVMDIAGIYGRLEDAFAKGNVVRVADCTLREGRSEHFVEVQTEQNLQEIRGYLIRLEEAWQVLGTEGEFGDEET